MFSALLIAAAATTTAATDPLVTFKDWVAGCDNGRSCMAVGQYSPENFNLTSVVVERGPLPEDAPVIWFRNGDGEVIDLAADGKRLGVKLIKDADEYNLNVAVGSVPVFIAALKTATTLTTVRTDSKPGEQLSISGAAAAMRWIDAQQKRVGTVTALVATGPGPAADVPSPPPLPVVDRAVPSGALGKPLTDPEIRKIQEEYAECSDDDLEGKVDYGRIDAHTTLAIVTAICGSGAYNYFGIPLLLRDDGTRTVADFGPKEEGDLTMNLSWDARSATLSSSFKGRGIGDCGGGTDYVWDGQRFRIVRESMMGECLGAIAWIPTFRARVVPR